MKKPQKVGLSRALRQNQTDAEAKLWLHLKNRQLNGAKFRRQRSLGNFIVDFVCFEYRLIVEIDGGHHNIDSVMEKDRQRTQKLETDGFKILRFWNNDVIENVDGVLLTILDELNPLVTPSPNLSHQGRGIQ